MEAIFGEHDSGKWLFWGIVGIGAVYLVLKALNVAKGAVAAATAPAVNQLADWYAQLTMAGATIPTGVAVLPDGSSVSIASIAGGLRSVPNPASPAGISGAFNYGGRTWYLNSAGDSNGNYAASTSLGYP